MPTNQTMPTQQGTTVPASDYGTPAAPGTAPASSGVVVTAAGGRGSGRPMTIKSSYNRLAYVRRD